MPVPIEDSKVLLTGASGGIGHAVAHTLHARGAILTLTGRRAEALDQLAAQLGDRAQVIVADLAERADLERVAQHDEFDVLVANAALPASGRYDDHSPADIDAAVDVNLRAPIQLACALASKMEERGHGHIVLISSLSGKVASPSSSIYSATKFGLRGFGFGLYEDLRGTGVGVTTVFPGFVREAGMFAKSGVKLPKGVATRTPQEVAAAVVEGIEKGRPEIDVAPVSLRFGGWMAGPAPGVVSAIQRRLGGDAVSRGIAAGHSKRS